MTMQTFSRRNVLLAAGVAIAASAARTALAQATTSDKEAEGRLAAQGWLVLLDRKDWGRAWETTASAFRAKVPLGTWMDAIPKVREPLGAMVDRTPVETVFKTSLQGQPAGEVQRRSSQHDQRVGAVHRDQDGAGEERGDDAVDDRRAQAGPARGEHRRAVHGRRLGEIGVRRRESIGFGHGSLPGFVFVGPSRRRRSAVREHGNASRPAFHQAPSEEGVTEVTPGGAASGAYMNRCSPAFSPPRMT